ncbi:Hypothetical protein A7982_02948 [Minicystis rosea]|nr:Hypothetical protein A7982_02948 [Minicystis rosea]
MSIASIDAAPCDVFPVPSSAASGRTVSNEPTKLRRHGAAHGLV